MSELAEALELMHTAIDRWRTLRAAGREWRHRARATEAWLRWIPRTRSRRVTYLGDPEDEPEPEETEERWRLWLAKPDRTLGGRVTVWDVSSWRAVSTLSGIERFRAYSADLSPDGSRLVTGLGDGTARIWDVASGRELLRLAGHSGEVQDVRFSPDGTVVATASADSTIRLWDAASGEGILKLGATFAVTGIAFSPDGSRLASPEDERIVRVYTVRLGELMHLARDRVTRRLTDEECRRYLGLERCPASRRVAVRG